MIPYNFHNYIMTGTDKIMFLCPVGCQTHRGSVAEPVYTWQQCGTILLLGDTYFVSVVCRGCRWNSEVGKTEDWRAGINI